MSENLIIPNWAYAYGSPTGKGEIRRSPEDFIVEETLAFEPSGSGEHIFLQIQKRAKIPNMWRDNWRDWRMFGSAILVLQA